MGELRKDFHSVENFPFGLPDSAGRPRASDTTPIFSRAEKTTLSRWTNLGWTTQLCPELLRTRLRAADAARGQRAANH